MKRVRLLFLRGLFFLLPIAITIYVLHLSLSVLDSFIGGAIEFILGRAIPGAGLIASILLIFAAGIIVTNYLGAKLIAFAEKIIQRIPVVPKIYFGVKQLIDAFSVQGKQMFSKVVLVQYPKENTYAVGFLTGHCKGEVQEKTTADLVSVFIPTTPNPTSGMIILFPKEEIIYLDMTVEEGLKFIISAGVVIPDDVKGNK